MIKDGRPYTNEHENGDIDNALLTSLPDEKQTKVLDWISINFIPIIAPLTDYNSYRLKHMLEEETGVQLSNNQFKDAMLLSGYKPIDPNELNWHFNISARYKDFTPQTQEKSNSFFAGDISNNTGIVGNVVDSDAPTTINIVPESLDGQAVAMWDVYNKLSLINRAKLLVYADSLLENNNK